MKNKPSTKTMVSDMLNKPKRPSSKKLPVVHSQMGEDLGRPEPAAPADPVALTLRQRGARHGNFTDNATISQDLKNVARGTPNWFALTSDKRESIEVILAKIARILAGDPEFQDHWHDIQGYARLAEERCEPEAD